MVLAFVLLFYTHSLPCGNGTPQLAWLKVTTEEVEITFVSFNVDFRNQTEFVYPASPHQYLLEGCFDDGIQLCPFQEKS